MAQSLAEGLLPQLSDDGSRQTLTLIGRVDGNTLADVAVQRAGANDFVVVQQVDGKRDGGIIIQRLPGKKLSHGFLPPGAQGRTNFNIHGVPPYSMP